MLRLIAGVLLSAGATWAGSVQLNSAALDTSLFSTLDYASGLSFPLSMVELSDGSLGVGTGVYYGSPSTLTQLPLGGGTPQVLYTGGAGPVTGLAWAGNNLIYANSQENKIDLLQPGATPSSPMTSLGSLDFSFSADWDHAQMAVTTRPTPGQPGSYDVVFNVGSQFNDTLSTGTVSVAGLATATLNPDSLYMVRVTVNGSQATVSNPQQIASGIRNVIGMGFDAGTGDFYFADNAIDGPPGQGNDTDPTPPQADELNVIRAADIGTSVVNFGFPDCYIQYKTGAAVGSGCVQPLVAFQPINGSPTQGPTQMVFAPADFPVGFNHGVFVSFAGEPGSGTQNDDDGVVYYSFDTGQYLQFIAPAQAAIGKPLGLLATSDTLYLADYNYGSIEAITPSAPEPGTMAMGFGLFGLGAAAMRFRRSAGQAIRKGCV